MTATYLVHSSFQSESGNTGVTEHQASRGQVRRQWPCSCRHILRRRQHCRTSIVTPHIMMLSGAPSQLTHNAHTLFDCFRVRTVLGSPPRARHQVNTRVHLTYVLGPLGSLFSSHTNPQRLRLAQIHYALGPLFPWHGFFTLFVGFRTTDSQVIHHT
jgi:hypothetical protein